MIAGGIRFMVDLIGEEFEEEEVSHGNGEVSELR